MDARSPGVGPALVRVNGREQRLEEDSLIELLARLGYEPGRAGIAVALNGEIVRRDEWKSTVVRAGDEIDVVGAVQGG